MNYLLANTRATISVNSDENHDNIVSTEGKERNLLCVMKHNISESSLKDDETSLETISDTMNLIYKRDYNARRARLNTSTLINNNPLKLNPIAHSNIASYDPSFEQDYSRDKIIQPLITSFIIDQQVIIPENLPHADDNKNCELNPNREDKTEGNVPSITNSIMYSELGGFSHSNGSLSSNELANNLREEFSTHSNPLSVCILYGMINSVIMLPILISFGNIIYRDEFFRPYLPLLIKLTIVSGFIHQLCFSTFSTLPFSVGQVQDAGLIFLSSMASSIVDYCKSRGHDDEEILATTVIGLSLFTCILGVALFVIGRLKLASYIRILPTDVIGGYLAFIGFFCGQSGLSLMSSSALEDPSGTHRAFWLILPGLMGGVFIFVSVHKIKNILVLPICLVIILFIFYMTLLVKGYSLNEARADGWISQGNEPPIWYRTWDYFKFNKVVWSALPGQTMTLLSMIFVVSLSSALDVAAIDLELPNNSLAYNYELRMVGLSNIISGITGGYTGSYIFSQTIFTLRAGIRSRKSGYLLAFCEMLVVLIPVSILDYVPKFFFGSLLTMICIDLMIEWLWETHYQLTAAAYTVTLSTFISILVLGVEFGILAGVAVHVILTKLGFNVNETFGATDESVAETQKLHRVDSTVQDYGTVVIVEREKVPQYCQVYV